MRKAIIFILLGISSRLYPQPFISFKEIQDVDSIACSLSTGSCFADLYIKTMGQIEKQLKNLDSVTVRQVRKLELNFSKYFTQACDRYKNNLRLDKTWDSYFDTPNLSQLQLKLLGINAHINGDLWKALRDSYSADEIKGIAKTVFLFHQSLLTIYEAVYDDGIKESKKVKTLHTLSFGLSKKYGIHLLVKWRKRQIKIATLYYFDKKKFERKLNKVEIKREKIEELIIQQL